MRSTESARPWQSPWVAVLLSLCAAIPLLLPSLPPFIDLPAHYSGYHVQQHLAHSPDLARFYTFQWKFIPNLGVELLIVPLTPLVGLQWAVKMVIAAIPALAVAGMLWIAREAHGRLPGTAFFALPLSLPYPLFFGFVNYCLSIALALVAFALWLKLSNQRRPFLRSVLFALIAPAVMLAHVLGYGVLGVMAGGAIIGGAIGSGEPPLKALWQAVVACLPMAWPLILLSFWQGGSSPPSGGWLDFSRMAVGLATILREQWQWWDLLSGAIVLGVAAIPILFKRRYTYSPVLIVPAALVWLLVIVLPFNIFGSDFSNVRLISVACALTILAVRPRDTLPSWVATFAIAFFALRLIVTGVDLVRADAVVQQELEALNYIRPGSRVTSFVVVRCAREWEPPRLQHIGSYATSRRNAFSNDQFARDEGHMLGLRDRSRRLPAADVMLEPCSRWVSIPTLEQALHDFTWNGVDYLWLIDIPADRIPHAGVRAIWRNERSVLLVRDNDPEVSASH